MVRLSSSWCKIYQTSLCWQMKEGMMSCMWASYLSRRFYCSCWKAFELIDCLTPLSKGFPRQEYWNGLPFPSPGNLPDPGIEPRSHALLADSLLSEPPTAQTNKTAISLIPPAETHMDKECMSGDFYSGKQETRYQTSRKTKEQGLCGSTPSPNPLPLTP